VKKLQAPFAGLLILLTFFGCRKDLQHDNQVESQSLELPSSTINATDSNITESGWQGDLNWTEVSLPSRSVFHTNLISEISSETAEKGLVRIFKTTDGGNTLQSLPFEETVNGEKHYWYYQVNEGNVMISVDVYGTQTKPSNSNMFKAIVLNKSALEKFNASGKNASKLMTMSLNELTSR
jgi:hypothetical protein